jgi:hypothetical protein
VATRRRHSTLAQLPEEVVSAVNALLVEPGTTYDDIVAWLKDKGHTISRSAVGRYGTDFMAKLQEIKALEGQAEAIMANGGTPMAMEEALSKLFTAELLQKMLAGKLKTNMDFNFAAQTHAKLQSSSVKRELMKKEIGEKAAKVARQVADDLTDFNIPKKALDRIKERIYGIAPQN